ncbi:restriction endonuclease subunit S [Myxococcota bacterium]|nr:restriction endonuclease subunit S [Myxococcota bacterium]
MKPGWRRVKFGEVVRQVKEKADPQTSGLERFVAGEHMDTDDLRLRRWGDIGEGYLGPAFHARFRPGQVLYGSRRTYLRKVAVADFDGICANTTFVLESRNPDVLLPELLPFFMQTEAFHEHSKRESKGSVNPYVNFSDLAWYEFALPPIAEQRRIASVCQAHQQLRECHMAALRAAQSLAVTILHEDSIRLTSAPHLEVSAIVPHESPICYGIVQPGEVVNTGNRMIRVCDLDQNGRFVDLTDIAHVSATVDEQYKRSRVHRGDILVSVVGTIGRVARVPDELDGANIARALARIRIDPHKADPDFVATLLRSPMWQRKLTADSFETARKTLNIGVLESLQLPIPPMRIQQLMVDRWKTSERVTANVAQRLESVACLRSSALCAAGIA